MIKQFYLAHRWDPNKWTILGQSGTESNANKNILHILQNSKIGASPSDSFVSYLEHLWQVGTYLSAEMQLAYSTAQLTGLKTL